MAYFFSFSEMVLSAVTFAIPFFLTGCGRSRQLVSTGVLCRKASPAICLTRKSATSAQRAFHLGHLERVASHFFELGVVNRNSSG
jgi:hypothetical protein